MAHKLVETVDVNARVINNREAYRYCWRKNGEWLPTTWAEFALQTEVYSKDLESIYLLENDTIAIC